VGVLEEAFFNVIGTNFFGDDGDLSKEIRSTAKVEFGVGRAEDGLGLRSEFVISELLRGGELSLENKLEILNRLGHLRKKKATKKQGFGYAQLLKFINSDQMSNLYRA